MTQAANLGALGTNVNSSGIAQAAGGGTAGTAGVTGFKNRLINGNMVINQRGYSGTPTNGTYTLDRYFYNANASRVTISQSSTAPTGFTKSILVTSTAASTISTGDYTNLSQIIEGYNIADLAWGTASAKTVTLSFWVYCSLTGTFGGAVRNAGTGGYYGYPFTYTISSANTWTQVSVTIPGPTSYTWLTSNDQGLYVWWDFGTGTTYTNTAGTWVNQNVVGANGCTNLVGTNGATWYMTGAQLEVGTAATNFDVRSYGTELGLCQRYYYQYAGTAGEGGDASQEWMYPLNRDNTYRRTTIRHPVTMRSIPTVSSLSMRINDATNVTGSTQYLSTASWSATYSPSSTGDYMYLNDYKISAEL